MPSWSDSGIRVIATTSATSSWRPAATALAAASASRTAILTVDDGGPDSPALDQAATVVRISTGAGEVPADADDVIAVARALAHTHDLVLVGGEVGPLDQVHGAGWALADLCWPLAAPIVIAADPSPDSADRTTAAVAALGRRAIPASVVTIDDDTPPDLPITPADPLPQRRAGHAPTRLRPQLPASTYPPSSAALAVAQLLSTTDRTRWRVGSAPRGVDEPRGSARGSAGKRPARKLPALRLPARTGPPQTRLGQKWLGQKWLGRKWLALTVIVASIAASVCGYAMREPIRAASPYPSTSLPHPAADGGPNLNVAIPEHLQRSAAWPRHATEAGSHTPARPATAACPQHAHGVRGTRPDEATVARVDAAWTRIESWLSRHAPKDFRTLRAPASPGRIAALQGRMSVAFPADLVASLQRHDGSQPGGFALPASFHLFSIDEILDDWTSVCVVLANNSTKPDWYDPAFVPFAGVSDGGCLVVDQRPGGRGRVGEFYGDEGVTFDDWPKSVSLLLEQVAHALETGTDFAGSYRPVTAKGKLDWQLTRR